MTEERRRTAALQAYHRFEAANGIEHVTPIERDDGKIISFIGTTPDGREFGIGYTKDTQP